MGYSQESFNSIDRWLKQIRTLAHRKIVIILVGNKSDMKSERQVSTEKGETFAAEHDLLFAEVSALSGENIPEVFVRCAGSILTQIEMGQIDLDRDMHGGIQVVGTHPHPSRTSMKTTTSSNSSCC
jgi:GTPase SAR1 family protein